MSDLFPKKIGTYLPVGTNKNNKNTLPSINSLGEYAVEANAMPFKQAWRPVLHLPSSLSAQLLAKEKHEKQSPSETKVPSYWKMFFVYGFYCFLLLWGERPEGIYAVKTNHRPSLAWGFGLSWRHESSERAHPARVFFYVFVNRNNFLTVAVKLQPLFVPSGI